PLLPGGVPPRVPAVVPGQRLRLPACPSSRAALVGQAGRTECRRCFGLPRRPQGRSNLHTKVRPIFRSESCGAGLHVIEGENILNAISASLSPARTAPISKYGTAPR